MEISGQGSWPKPRHGRSIFSPQCFFKVGPITLPGFSYMDSDGLSFQTALVLAHPSVPLRCPALMPAQSITAWTPVSLASACIAWLTAETPLTPLAPAPATINRRA
jgi:hypothetical protein